MADYRSDYELRDRFKCLKKGCNYTGDGEYLDGVNICPWCYGKWLEVNFGLQEIKKSKRSK